MTFARFAVRRLNPYAGVAQVVAGDTARSISLDGSRWEIQVLAEAPNDCWGSLNRRAPSQTRFFRFGIWSNKTGLRRVPVNPIMDIGEMFGVAEPLIDEIGTSSTTLPFRLADTLELWLFDRHDKPLALMMSATPDEDTNLLNARQWCAASMHDRNLGHPLARDRSPVADEIEALVRRTGGARVTRWVRREAPGLGPGTIVGGGTDGSQIDETDFPVLPVRACWPDTNEQALIDRWIDWAAPRLLCLPYLAGHLRRRLELAARHNALEVSTLWRVYPPDVDKELIRTARVESRLRRAVERA